MDSPALLQRHCVPCEGGVPVLTPEEVKNYLKEVPGWETDASSKRISRQLKFKDFREALTFVNKVGELAEAEQHHPDITLGWGRVGIEIWTHAINGLSDNDFILAAKINALVQ